MTHAPDLRIFTFRRSHLRGVGFGGRLAGEQLQSAFNAISGAVAPRFSPNQLEKDLSRASAVDDRDETLRSAYWKGLIEVRFGDKVSYTPPAAAPGTWSNKLAVQVRATQDLLEFRTNPYAIVDHQ